MEWRERVRKKKMESDYLNECISKRNKKNAMERKGRGKRRNKKEEERRLRV